MDVKLLFHLLLIAILKVDVRSQSNEMLEASGDCSLGEQGLEPCNGQSVQVDVHSQPNEMPEALKDINEYLLECSIVLGPAVMQDIETNFYKDEILPEDRDSLNRHSGCMLKKMGIVNDNSDIDREALERYISAIATIDGNTSPESRMSVSAIATVCSEVKGSDYGQTAVKIQNCIYLATRFYGGKSLIL